MMEKVAFIFVCVAMAASLSACGPSTVRNYAAVLAADTGKLNDQFEQLTKSRLEIEAGRDRLSNIFELSTWRVESYNERRLAEWAALKTDPKFKERNELFNMVRTYTDAAASREATRESLASKVVKAPLEAKGRRSEQLIEAAKHLAALSKEPSLESQVKFLAGYAKNLNESLEKAEKDAKNASDAAKNKIDAVETSKVNP